MIEQAKEMETRHDIIIYSKTKIRVIECKQTIYRENIYKRLRNIFYTFQNQTQVFFIISIDNMTISAQNNLVLGDNTRRANLTFKKSLSPSSKSLFNSKGYHSKYIDFSINAYGKDK